MVVQSKEIVMKILIDGVPASVDADGLNTLQDLIRHLEKNCIASARVVTKIKVNEEELDEGQEVGLGAFPLSDIETVEVKTAKTISLALEALDDAQEYLPVVSAVLEASAKKIREGDVRGGLEDTGEALEVIGAFVEILEGVRVAFMIDFSKIRIDDSCLLDKMNDLARHSQAIFKAAKSDDWTMFADLMEYELSPLLYEWMAIIPELVSLLPGDGDSNNAA
jgi:hypothetical protein